MVTTLYSLVRMGGQKKVQISLNLLLNQFSIYILLWIALSLVPLVMFSNHTFPYYLPVSLFGFILFIINMLSEFFAKIKINSVIKLSYLALIIVFWFWSGLTVMNFNSKVHWTPRRASEAQEVISKLTPLIKPTTHYIVNIKNKGYYLPLNNQDALHVVFGENVETVYGELSHDPETILLYPTELFHYN